MLFRTHLVFGVFCYLLVLNYVSGWLWVLLGVLLGVVFPDLDSRHSRYGQRWYFRPFQWFVKHRGVTHSLFFGLLLVAVLAIFSVDLAFGFMVGFISHLFMDVLTKRGVAFLWPLSRRRFGVGIRTGGIIEDVLFVLLLLTNIFVVGYFIFNSLF